MQLRVPFSCAIVFGLLTGAGAITASAHDSDGWNDDGFWRHGRNDDRLGGPAVPKILVLSNRADLVSGGDALVEIKWPNGSNLKNAKVSLNGRSLTDSFAVRPNGRYMGLISGLREGPNILTAQVPGRAAQITITNHPSGGPVFSGAQLQPWICATQASMTVNVTGNAGQQGTANTIASGLNTSPATNDPPGASKCETPPTYTYYYKRTTAPANCNFAVTGANACFTAYTPGSPATVPADAANITNDRGDTVKYLIRVERGSINRGIYELVTLYDPRDANVAWLPPKGWNQKLYWRFGGGGGASRFESAPSDFLNVFTPPIGIDPNANIFRTALERGFMIAISPQTDGLTTTNATVSAETIMMVKERIVEQYGEIRYTMSDGGSGGSVMQHSIASAYPGLLQGVQPTLAFPDEKSVHIEITDCGLLQATSAQFPGSPGYYSRPGPGASLTEDQKSAINGHMNTKFCNSWIGSFGNFDNPRVNNCGNAFPVGQFPTALTYNPTTNKNGLRCDDVEHVQSQVGRFVDSDGVLKTRAPYDNVGVQYGLKALTAGVITAEDFVSLNEGIGGFDLDLVWHPTRMKSDSSTLKTYYTGGLVSDGRQLAKVAIVERRVNNNPDGDNHMNHGSLGIRDRLDRDHGSHANHMLWLENDVSDTVLESFNTLDAWLHAIELDDSVSPIEAKVVAHKPVVAGSPDGDFCKLDSGTRVGIFDANCPVKFYKSPRMAAGGPIAENVFKCQLKPFNPSSADYNGVIFGAAQIARLNAVFSEGVCDWTKPGVEQQPVNPWTTFEAGPGGVRLPRPPTSEALEYGRD
ncbi:hypothetical protein VAR608DRAFT_1437 [Variovorax sp. HW608]|uniref:DUF6351 family protein n=1 Tax=Variovorax sp. HW608 TaxID=1034889 RepID=UPI00081FD7CD|nr:DUF6351 family protein [Variovorax sp. HW608]SCK19643.1 hypothetical protein VAR608DRAFT_1437 [Variovorax sp. HW608]